MSAKLWLEGIFLFSFGLVGIIGNISAVFVFYKRIRLESDLYFMLQLCSIFILIESFNYRRIQRNFHILMLFLSVFDLVRIPFRQPNDDLSFHTSTRKRNYEYRKVCCFQLIKMIGNYFFICSHYIFSH